MNAASSKTKININGFGWLIEEVAENDMPNPPNDDSVVAMGRTYTSTCHIYMNNKLRTKVFYSTLIHELTHAFLFSHGFIQVDYTDEIICDFVGAYGNKIVAIANKYMKNRKRGK